jgi:hypothetical protein
LLFVSSWPLQLSAPALAKRKARSDYCSCKKCGSIWKCLKGIFQNHGIDIEIDTANLIERIQQHPLTGGTERGNRVPIPACICLAICDRWPSLLYVGFRKEEVNVKPEELDETSKTDTIIIFHFHAIF